MMRAEVVPPASSHWAEALGTIRHDLYHLPGYASFSAVHEEPGELTRAARSGYDMG